MSRDPWRVARWGLAVRFALLVTLLVVVGGGGLYAYFRHALLGAFDAAHDLALNSVRETVSAPGGVAVVDAHGFAEEVEELKGLGVVAIAVWTDDGHVLASTRGEDLPLAMVGPRREVVGAGARAFVVRRQAVALEGGAAVVVGVGRRAGDVGRELDSFVRGMTLIVPAALVGALLIGWMMAGQSLRRVHAAYDRQRAFMADASHELRTPLSVIRAQAEVQLEGGTDASRRRALEVVAQTAARMGTLVNDLLFLSRSDGSTLTLKLLSVSLTDLVEEVVAAFAPMAEQRRSRLELASAGEDVEVEADPTQLERLFGILIDNALRHGVGPIVISVAVAGSEAIVIVEDRGPGISASLLPKVFDRFVRGGPPNSEGHGLGLAIARAIVVAHQGAITLERGELGGTAARVRLPVRGRA